MATVETSSVSRETLVDRFDEFVRDGTGVALLVIDELGDADFADAPGMVGPSWVKKERVSDLLTVEYRRAR